MSTSYSQSTSQSSPVPTHENDLIDQLSGVAAGLANQMYSWAQGVYAQTSQITNQAVGNFFQVSQNMLGMSNNLTNQYNNLFAPENAQLVAEANSYASPARMKVNMGMAGATQAQAGDAALRNSEESLRSYGINPSDGRYAALDKAAAVQNAANVAGAENMQRNNDIATGQKLRSEAVQVGAQLPAAIANINNTAIQANTGASNASLANANTGANLMRLPNDYLGTAMNVKLPPMAQQSQSTSRSGPQGGIQSNGWPQGGGSGGGGAGNGVNFGGGASNNGRGAWQPEHFGGANGGPAVMSNPYFGQGSYNDPSGNSYDLWGNQNSPDFSYLDQGGGADYYQPQQGYDMGVGQAGLNDPYQSYDNPFDNGGFGQTFDWGGSDQTYGGMGGGTDTQFGNISYDSGANNYDPGWDQTYDQPNPDTNWGDGASAYQDYGQGGYDTGSSGSDYYAGDYSAPSDSYDMGGAYAKGGPIPGRPAHAGPVPTAMSPSGGRQVDDVSARGPQGSQLQLDAEEFVIPRDVALWKGQEFFQKLIDQSRKLRTTAPAHGQPTQGQPTQGQPPQPRPMR